jgi:hypothetical protein
MIAEGLNLESKRIGPGYLGLAWDGVANTYWLLRSIDALTTKSSISPIFAIWVAQQEVTSDFYEPRSDQLTVCLDRKGGHVDFRDRRGRIHRQ